jgi:magnesium-transporting ATPase (P-type)
MAFMGSAVTSGRGRGVVAATASDTQLGQIAESIKAEEQPPTPLQQRMHRFANIIGAVVLGSTSWPSSSASPWASRSTRCS